MMSWQGFRLPSGFEPIVLAVVGLVLAGTANAEDRCSLRSQYASASGLAPVHSVSFIFTGVQNEDAAVSVDGATIFQKPLETRDWSTEYSGGVNCMMAGRYRVEVKIGVTRAIIRLDIQRRRQSIFRNTMMFWISASGDRTHRAWTDPAISPTDNP